MTHTGCPMEIVYPTKHRHLKRGVELSAEARLRLKYIDWFNLKTDSINLSKEKRIEVTCAHFGIHKLYF